MSDALRNAARRLLEGGDVRVVIGHGAGSDGQRLRPAFIRGPEQLSRLLANGEPGQNLAVYLLKPEVRALGKPALVARGVELRTLLQYAAESQLAEDAVVALAVAADGSVTELASASAIEEYLAQAPRSATDPAFEELARLEALPREQRWAFWDAEFARCIKCYACRAACPLCYCTRCIVDCNQPQWVPVASDSLGVLSWNVVRAMHLAGRCIHCDSCAAACPQDIRLDLLNRALAAEARAAFGSEPGFSRRKEYALSVFKPDDKEEFIR